MLNIDDIMPANNTINVSERFAELARWQETQKRFLEERQNKQRALLGLEQRSVYQMLGLVQDNVEPNSTDDNINNSEVDNDDDDEEAISAQARSAEKTEENTQRTSGYDTDEQITLSALNTNKIQKPKFQFLRRNEGIKQRYKIDPAELRLDKLPPYKYANTHRNLSDRSTTSRSRSSAKLKAITKNRATVCNELDALDLPISQQFERFLVQSVPICNSTPDLKLNSKSPTTTASHHVKFSENIKTTYDDTNNNNSKSTSPAPPMTWAKVLNSEPIKPVLIKQRAMQVHYDDDDNLNIFELIEQKAREGSIDPNSSCIREFMARKERRRQEDCDDVQITQHLQNLRLQPEVSEVINDNSPLVKVNETPSDGYDASRSSAAETTPQCDKNENDRARVRFSESLDTHEYNETENDNEPSYMPMADVSTNSGIIEEIKAVVFKALEKRNNDDGTINENSVSTVGEEQSKILNEKATLVTKRVQELEKEIAMFKENNRELLKMKQTHELQRSQNMDEHAKAMEQLKDEKIQFEIYIHDENMKLDEEKRNFREQMRMQKQNLQTKDKKEIARLTAEIDALQAQLKHKEQIHTVAQGRLRTQIRILEKDQRALQDEIERLGKENKKLQLEAIKIGREQSNKMLQEINRNIARLAPKLEQTKPQTITNAHDVATQCKHPITNKRVFKRTVTRKPFGDAIESDEENFLSRVAKPSTQRNENVVVAYKPTQTTPPKTPPLPTNFKSDEESQDLTLAAHELRALDAQPDLMTINSTTLSTNNTNDYIEQSTINNSKNMAASRIKDADTPSNEVSQDFKREIVHADGSKEILYANQNVKTISADGMQIRMVYFNKDIKETNIREGIVRYYYASSNTWHSSYLDGLEIYQFPDGQTEHRYKNGVVKINFPNNVIKTIDPFDETKEEEWSYPDGAKLVKLKNGDKIITLSNGQKEIHTKLYVRREYPDGTVKLVYPDGSQETRYSNGRIRLKDKDGTLIADTSI